jgi:uncharacterized membrane protein YoaK (UPF0700 family)
VSATSRSSQALLAILAFALGAIIGGRSALRRAPHRGRLLAAATALQAGLVIVAAIVADVGGVHGSTARLTLIGLLAVAMGGQNAVARRLAVPDLTTTVLTLTFTGLVADATSTSVRIRRLVPIVAMLGGALIGGVLLRWVSLAAPTLAGCHAAGHLRRERLRRDPSPTLTCLAVAKLPALATHPHRSDHGTRCGQASASAVIRFAKGTK